MVCGLSRHPRSLQLSTFNITPHHTIRISTSNFNPQPPPFNIITHHFVCVPTFNLQHHNPSRHPRSFSTFNLQHHNTSRHPRSFPLQPSTFKSYPITPSAFRLFNFQPSTFNFSTSLPPSTIETYSVINSAFNSDASAGFIFPPRIKRTCLLRKAPSNSFRSSSVSGTNCGTILGLRLGSSATKV
jgi:hypothetical protein